MYCSAALIARSSAV